MNTSCLIILLRISRVVADGGWVEDDILPLFFLKGFHVTFFGDALFSFNEEFINQASPRWIESVQICGALKVKLD